MQWFFVAAVVILGGAMFVYHLDNYERTRLQRFLDYYPITQFDRGQYGVEIRHGPTLATVTPLLLRNFDWWIGNKQPVERCDGWVHLPIADRIPQPPISTVRHRIFYYVQRFGLDVAWLSKLEVGKQSDIDIQGSSAQFTEYYRRVKDPRTVLADQCTLQQLIVVAKQDFDAGHANRVLVIPGNADTLMSDALGRNSSDREKMIMELKQFFRSIRSVTKDMKIDGVSTMPIGLSEMYLRHPGVVHDANAAIVNARLDDAAKPKNVLVAFGRHTTDNIHLEYYQANPVLFGGGKYSFYSRYLANEWAESDAARAAGAEQRSIKPRLWWRELAKYKFLISPLGLAMQNPKPIEALLVLTIPIIRRGPSPAFDEMALFGFPLIVVTAWDEVTLLNITNWWRTLSPRLESFRDNCLTADAYWRMIIGEVERCE